MLTKAQEFARGYRVLLAAVMGSGTGVAVLVAYSLGALVTSLEREFGWTRAQIMAAPLVYSIGVLIAGAAAGALVDRYGARRVALASQLLLAAGLAAMSQIGPQLWAFYLAYLVLPMIAAGTLPVTWTRAVIAWFATSRGLALGLSLVATGMIGAVLPGYVTWLIAVAGWRVAYLGLAAVPLVIGLPPALAFFREPAVVRGDSECRGAFAVALTRMSPAAVPRTAGGTTDGADVSADGEPLPSFGRVLDEAPGDARADMPAGSAINEGAGVASDGEPLPSFGRVLDEAPGDARADMPAGSAINEGAGVASDGEPLPSFGRVLDKAPGDARVDVPRGSAINAAAGPAVDGVPPYSFGGAIRTRSFWQMSGSFVLAAICVSAVLTHAIPLLLDRGVPASAAAALTGLFGLAVTGGRLLTGYLLDGYSGPALAFAVFTAGALACVVLMLCGDNRLLCGSSIVLVGVAAGGEADIGAYLTTRYFGRAHYGAIYGLFYAIYCLGGGFGPLLAGLVHDRTGSYRGALLVGAGGFAVAAFLAATLKAPPSYGLLAASKRDVQGGPNLDLAQRPPL